MVSRRVLLLGAPALALSACGKAEEEPQEENPNVDTGTQKQGDIDLLRALLDEEQGLRTILLNATPPPPRQRPLLAAMRADTDRQTTALQQAIRTLGGGPPELGQDQPATRFDPTGVLAEEARLVAVYVDFIPKLSDGRVRELTAKVLADKSARLAQLRILLDEPPVPEAFVP